MEGYFVLLSWMPVYFKSAAWFSAVPWETMAFSGYLAGTASDFLINAGYPTTFVRKLMQTIGFIGPAVTLLCLNYANTPTNCCYTLDCSFEFELFQPSWIYAQHTNIAPQYAGILHGKKLGKFVGNPQIPRAHSSVAAFAATNATGHVSPL
ncbi:probable anion transporter 3, chloroplastic [Cicer arietinum]|uniref:probable anion transporter 3, chloroplastic n=1 Tax=Cicer arietinum TaxID=3827 RepID=UPI003CC5B784